MLQFYGKSVIINKYFSLKAISGKMRKKAGLEIGIPFFGSGMRSMILKLYTAKVREILGKKESPPLCFVHSFGCQQNVSDGEKILGILSDMGYGITAEAESADLIIYNTCAVRENAEKRVYGMLGALKHMKEKKPELIIGLCGCMAEEEKNVAKIRSTYRQVDLVFGTHALTELPRLVYEVLTEHKFVCDTGEYGEYSTEIKAVRSSSFKASVPIMYGCDNFCSYCIVPYVRGREKSRRPSEVVNEVKELSEKGYKEIMLLGQNVNSYGKNLDKPVSFAELLRMLENIDGDFKIRFMSPHPKDCTKELIDTIFECGKVCRHFHLPLQSGSDEILKRMNRRYTAGQYMDIVSYIREKDPGFSLTTDIIVGFPNETEEDFLKTMEIVKKVKYDNIYSFIYSKRSGTKAAEMEDKISDEEKSRRMTELLRVQREISTEHYKRFLGRTLDVLFDGESRREGVITGKSDEFIIVEAPCPDKSAVGQRRKVKITEAHNWALNGEII